MARPPYHMTSLSLDSDGWIQTQTNGGSGSQGHGDSRSIEITPSCKRLLKEIKLDLSCDIFNGNYDSKSSGKHDDAETPLEELSHLSNLHNSFLKVVADIRRLGAPSEAELRRKDGKDKGEGGKEKRPRNRRGGRNGKVAQLEEQRRLRKQQEQQKLEQTQQKNQAEEDEEKSFANGEKDDGKEIPPDKNTFITVGASSDTDLVQIFEIPVELRLAAVFNSLRILITLMRPMLNHPQRKDLKIKMKNGPSIQKQGKNSFYLISMHVYSCVSQGCWNEINREYTKLLNEMQEGLSDAMSKLSSDGQYELDLKDWVVSLFNHEFYTNPELVAEKCMGLSTSNSEVASKVHNALMNRFESDHGEKQHMLQRSIDQLQNKLHSAISRRFRGARLTVYGSCLSGLALEGSHDVDVSIFIPELDHLKKNFDAQKITAAEYEKRMRKIIYRVRDALEYTRSFFDLFAITRARVPVIKGTDTYAQNPYTQDGSLSFDLCFLNDIAVVNSSLLREYSLFDSRVRILMLSIKSFAKTNGIASAADGTLSSYSWLNMVVFYLQCIGLVPVLQCRKLMEEHHFTPNPTGDPWHSVNGLETFYLTKDLVAEKKIWECSSQVKNINMSTLLYGFFNFYSNVFPHETVAASIRFGNCTLQKTSLSQTSKLWRLCMEDPFETCNSHCPHDLGCHVKEDGQKKISEQIMRAAEQLSALMEEQTSDDNISIILCQLLGPMPKSNSGKVQRGAAGSSQSKRHHLNTAHHQDTGNGTARGNNRNAGAKGGHTRNNQQHGNNGNGSQMKGGRGGGSRNDRRDHAQKTNGERGNNTKKHHGNNEPNSARLNKQTPQANNPGVNKKFIEKQKKRLQHISDEKNRNAETKEKDERGNTSNAAVKEKLDTPLVAKR